MSMSRIESILEKATKLRGGGDPVEIPQRLTSPTPQILSGTFPEEMVCKVANSCLVTITEPNSPIAEEYKKLKSMVIKATNSETFLNTLMVTSTIAAEGKSLTSINLAVSLAQEYDHTVLLIDADLRKPSISEYLGIPRAPGLADCLVDGVPVSEVLVKTGIGKLMVIPAGKRIDNPAELFSSGRMQAFISEVKNRYPDRYVIFDTPPVLSFADANILSAYVDGVLFVVKEEGATVKNIKEALNSLRDSKILGMVYSNVEISRFDSNYNYRSYYSNHYKYGEQ
jgi:exopolysaccharide/PEP-CTERM locus tyrosine autokinase